MNHSVLPKRWTRLARWGGDTQSRAAAIQEELTDAVVLASGVDRGAVVEAYEVDSWYGSSSRIDFTAAAISDGRLHVAHRVVLVKAWTARAKASDVMSCDLAVADLVSQRSHGLNLLSLRFRSGDLVLVSKDLDIS